MSMAETHTQIEAARAVVYSDSLDHDYTLKVRLTKEKFQLVFAHSPDTAVALCRRYHPEILLIKSTAAARDVISVIRQLTGLGIDFNSIPTFLLVRGPVVRALTPLLKIGLQDVIDFDEDMDALIGHIRRIRANGTASSGQAATESASGSSSRGNLRDMSIIDLLQALGPSRRTIRITVTPAQPGQDSLMIYLNHGNISHAALGELKGEKAIHQALSWEKGTWLLEPIAESELPEPNNTLPNEHILMEGCRLIDERSRETVASDSAPSS